MRKILIFLIISILSSYLLGLERESGDWRMFQYDAHHTGRSPYACCSDWGSMSILWSVDVGSQINYAAYKDSVIYFATTDGNLHAVKYNGTILWTVNIGGECYGGPAILPDGSIVIGNRNNQIKCFNHDGSLRWVWTSSVSFRGIVHTPTIGIDNMIYACGYFSDSPWSGWLISLRTTGALNWSNPAPGSGGWISCSPAVDNDTLIFTVDYSNPRGELVCWSKLGGILWRFTGYCSSGEVDLASSPTVDYSRRRIYFGGNRACPGLAAVNYSRSSASLAWFFSTSSSINISPALDLSGNIYVGTDNGTFYSFTPDGSLRWTFSAGGRISDPIVEPNGRVLFGSADSTLYILDKESGNLLSHIRLSAPVSSPIIGASGTIYVGAGGKFYAIGCGSAASDSATICIYIPECTCIGPHATVLSPLPCGIITGCERQEIRILARDNDTLVNPSTVSIVVNGITYRYPSNISVRRDTIIFTPSSDWRHGDTIRYTLISADDYWGCPLDSSVSCWFVVDTRPPEVVSFFPPRDTVLNTTVFPVWIELTDAPAGIDTTSFTLSVDGRRFSYPADSAVLRWSGGRLYFNPAGRIRFAPYDTVRFCLEHTRDRVSPSYCGPNELESPFCWNVYIDVVGPRVRIITPRPDSISACTNQEIRILLQDPSGIDQSSVVLNINGTSYRINPPQLRLIGDTLIFSPPAGFWEDNDTINVGVYARDRYGNGLAPFELTDSLSVILFRPGGSGPTGGLAFNGRYLLYVIGASGPDSIGVYDIVSDTRIYARQTNINMMYDIAYYNGFIYASGSTGRVFKLDTLTFSAIDTSDSNYGMGHTIGLTGGGGYIWAAYDCSTIVKLDPVTLAHRGYIRITPQPEILAGLAWMCDMLVGYVNNNMIILIDPSTGVVTGSLPVFEFPADTTGPEGLTYDFVHGRLWASNLYSTRRRIYGFTPFLPGCSDWNWYTDFSPPNITLFSPRRDTVITDSTFIVRICLSDNVSGVNFDSVRISVDGRAIPHTLYGNCLSANVVAYEPQDTMIICLDNAQDMPDYCEPNDTSFCWSVIVDRIGPRATIVMPLNNTISACRDQRIIMLIDDVSGVDTNSIRLEINSTIYNITSPSLFWRYPDSLIFVPPSDTFWHNGQNVLVRLLEARDINGNPLQGAPIEWRFTFDFTPPVLSDEYPGNGSIVTEFTPTIGIFIVDSISGVDFEHIRIRIRTNWYNFGERGIFFDNRTGELRVEPSMLGISFDDGETVSVCVDGVWDSPDYCPPNAANMYCWSFRVSVSGPVARIIEPMPGTYSACEDQRIIIFLHDPDSVNPSSIRLLVQGIEYSVDNRNLLYRNDTLIFVPDSGQWYDGEVVNVQFVEAEDIYGNRLSRSLEWSFTMDFSAPIVIYNRPVCGRWIADSIPTIEFTIQDNISGVRDSSVRIVVNGASFGFGSPALSRDGNRWIFSAGAAGMVFHEGDSVSYCIYATDSPQYCPPNNLEFCCTFYVGLQGPVASIVLPQPNTFTACNPQEIVITISDTDGVVPSSILLEVSGRQFTISAPELTYRNDTLRFAPSWLFNNGDTIRVRLIQANDTLGNPLQNPLDFSFFVDLMPPVVLDFSPHEYQVVATPTPTISFVLADSLSGLDTSSFAIIIDNRDTFRVENITWERISSSPSQGRITFETSESGLHWNHNDTATICLIAADNPDYCAPNVMSFCYRFRFDLEGPVSTLINPPMNIISSCVRQGFAVYITDTPIPSEIDTSTIVVAITSRTRNDTLYNTSPYLSWSGDTLIFTPPVDYWVDSETVNVTVVDIRDIYGNRQSSPLSFSFTLDFTPPFVINASPLAWEEVPDRTPIITFTLLDRVSGVLEDSTSVRISVNDTLVGSYTVSSPALTHIGVAFTFSTEIAGITLNGGDTVEFCVTALDLAQLCGPNMLDSCWNFTVPVGGPRARIIEPLDNTFSACEDQRILIRIRDLDGVDSSTILVNINGVEYNISSPEIDYRNDTLIFTPSWLWTNGESVNVNLVSADDIFGNHLETPLYFSFVIDTAPPVFTPITPIPNETVSTRCPDIAFTLFDSLSGLDTSSVRITINGNIYRLSDLRISWDGRTARANACSLGLRFSGGDTIQICIYGTDSPDYCPPNTLDICYNFFIESGGPVARIIQPNDSSFVACSPETIIIELTDSNGVLDSTIVLEIDGTIYRPTIPGTIWYNGRYLFFTRFFMDNDTVNVRLIEAYDSLGNPLSNPISFTFITDYSPPYIFNPVPGFESTVEDISPLIRFGLVDDISGVERESIEVRINGRLFTPGMRGLWWEDDTVYFDPDSVGMSFMGGDTVEVCVRAFDRPDTCGPNLLNTCYRFYIARGGPVATIIEPNPGTYSACDSQRIIISIMDTNGVDPSSISLRINGIVYTVDSSCLSWNPPYLIYTPPPFFLDGMIVSVELLQANDNLGNPLERTLSWNFTMDLSPPTIINITPAPDDIVDEPQPDIIVRAFDRLSGINLAEIRLTINGTSYDASLAAVIISGDTIIFYPESLGIRWHGGDRIDVCIHLEDNPDYCEPNTLDSCWAFYIATGGPRATIIRPLNNTISACEDQEVVVLISDPQGVNPSTIRLSVRGTIYNTTNPELHFSNDTLRFTPPEGFWSDNETVYVELDSASDILGNPLEAAPVRWSFMLDFSPPVISDYSPHHMSSSLDWQQDISCDITDNLLGVDPSSIRLTLEGVYRASGAVTLTLSSTSLQWSPPTLIFFPESIAASELGITYSPTESLGPGIYFPEFETIRVSIYVSDRRPNYCESHNAYASWIFTISDDDTTAPSFTNLSPTYWADDSSFYIYAEIFDSSGIFADSVYLIWDNDGSVDDGSFEIVAMVAESLWNTGELYGGRFRTVSHIPAQRYGVPFVYRICAYDNDFDFMNPADRRKGCVDGRVAILTGPTATPIEPSPGTITACYNQRIIIAFSDSDGVDMSSIVLSINGRIYDISSPEIQFVNDTVLYWTPQPDEYFSNNEVVEVRVIAAKDMLGNPMRTSFSYRFEVDLEPPELTMIAPMPNSIVREASPRIEFNIEDNLSGINPDSILVRIQGQRFTVDDGILWRDGRLIVDCDRLGIRFEQGDTVDIELWATDNPDYCSPNRSSESWRFVREPLIYCAARPNPFTPNGDGYNDFTVFDYPFMFTERATIVIYDRWNVEVFRKDVEPMRDFFNLLPRSWDGRDKSGHILPQGVYIYIVKVRGEFVCNGTIILAR